MIIELGKKGNHFGLHLQGGWVTKEISERIENALKATCWNFNYIGGRQSALKEIGNEVKVIFNIDARRDDCQEFVDYLNAICQPVMASAFFTIAVSPYDLPDYNNEGALTLLLEIAKETGCEFDPGEWLQPCTFKPQNNEQYNRVIDLLLAFNMSFFNWDYVGGKREAY